MGKWAPSRWLLRRGAAVGWRESQSRLAARLGQIGSESGNGPSPDFRVRLREELLAAYGAKPGPAQEVSGHRPRPLRPGWRRAAVFVASTASLMTVTVMQTYASVPGDRLYPIKRAAEATLLSLTTDDATRAQRELNAAHSRATEAAALLGYPDSQRAKFIGQALDEMTTTTRSALSALGNVKRRDAPPTPALRSFTQRQREVVAPMIPQLGGDDRMKASAYLDMIDDLTPEP